MQYAGLLDTGRRVCEIQFSQILTFTSNSALGDPEHILHYYKSTRNRRRQHYQSSTSISPFRNPHHLQSWADDPASAIFTVRGCYATRQIARDFTADAIEIISAAEVPVVWALRPRHTDSATDTNFSATDVLKQLVLQVLRINHALLDERSVALNAARFQSATTVSEWFGLLGAVLAGLPLVYFVVDLDTVGKSTEDGVVWAKAFAELFAELRARGVQTVVKVALVSCRAARMMQAEEEYGKVLVIPRGKCAQGSTSLSPARAMSSQRKRKSKLFSLVKRSKL